ncbi:MAG: universal stress protein [Eubacteriales bacterium]
MFKKIMVAFDGSDHSIKALRMAADIARKYRSSVSVVTAVNLPELPDRCGRESESFDGGFSPELELASAIAAEEKIKVVTHYLRGKAAVTILRFAEDNQLDLVVIGARGRNAVQRFLLGSVSSHLVNNLKCTVLVAKEKST